MTSGQDNREFSPYRVAAVAAIGAGALRLFSPFLDWSSSGAALEAYALVVDLGLLFGLSGFYFKGARRLGVVGLIGYVIASAGLAAITGPDGVAFGVDIYAAGAHVIGVGLLVLSLALLLARTSLLAAISWIAAAVISVGGGALGKGDISFTIAGIFFALGFIAAGADMLRAR